MREGDKEDLFSREYKRKLKLVLKTKLSGKNGIVDDELKELHG